MKLKTLYDTVIKKGSREDQRSKKAVEEALKETRKAYRKTKGVDRTAFDKERLKHPYDDTRILFGTGNEEVKNVMIGIDVGVQELFLAIK